MADAAYNQAGGDGAAPAEPSMLQKIMALLTADNKQRLTFLMKAALELFKISIGCFLVVFVPQSCGDHTCSFKENIAELDNGWNIFSLVFNLVTFLVLCGHYAIDLMRENWVIQNFDVDQEVGDNALQTTLKEERHSDLKAALDCWNRRLVEASVVMVAVFVCNLSFSAATILHFYYDGFRSATVLLTNTLLVVSRVQRVLLISFQSHREGLALSTALTEALSYNVIDKVAGDGFDAGRASAA